MHKFHLEPRRFAYWLASSCNVVVFFFFFCRIVMISARIGSDNVPLEVKEI